MDLQQPQQLDSKALFDLIFHNVIAPSNGTELTIYYLIWIVAYLLINIIWDIKTDKTPKFFISGISNKQNLLHQAASLPSNILIIVACINPIVWELAKEIKLPLLISGISGIIASIPALCPYSTKFSSGEAAGAKTDSKAA